MIFSKDITKVFVLIAVLFLSVQNGYSQQSIQKIAFVDIEYVLQNVSSYNDAQAQLNKEVDVWKQNLDKLYLKLNKTKQEFLSEKPLLTEELIKERELEIVLQEQELVKVENTYFGSDGKLFQLRKQLVTPFQDMVYNAVQSIAKSRKYDMVFEKSSSLVLLYTNNNYDISNLVLKYLQKSQKEIEKEEADEKRAKAQEERLKRIEDQKKLREEQLLKNKTK